jgi:hypothetical protein
MLHARMCPHPVYSLLLSNPNPNPNLLLLLTPTLTMTLTLTLILTLPLTLTLTASSSGACVTGATAARLPTPATRRRPTRARHEHEHFNSGLSLFLEVESRTLLVVVGRLKVPLSQRNQLCTSCCVAVIEVGNRQRRLLCVIVRITAAVTSTVPRTDHGVSRYTHTRTTRCSVLR